MDGRRARRRPVDGLRLLLRRRRRRPHHRQRCERSVHGVRLGRRGQGHDPGHFEISRREESGCGFDRDRAALPRSSRSQQAGHLKEHPEVPFPIAPLQPTGEGASASPARTRGGDRRPETTRLPERHPPVQRRGPSGRAHRVPRPGVRAGRGPTRTDRERPHGRRRQQTTRHRPRAHVVVEPRRGQRSRLHAPRRGGPPRPQADERVHRRGLTRQDR